MIIKSDLKLLKCRDSVELECERCGGSFYKHKNKVLAALKANGEMRYNCCSDFCYSQEFNIVTNCSECQKSVKRGRSSMKKNKSTNVFCSRSCATTYHNKHKTHGAQRSKLEMWLETKLLESYPNLKIHFNRTDSIKAELDIYIPSLQLAFELNGPFHYEPIFGAEKLAATQNNDQRKFQACLERNIELCIVDVSKQRYFKEKTCLPFLEIIAKIINQKMVTREGLEPSAS